jgi:DNA-binding response OmpR family regulator
MRIALIDDDIALSTNIASSLSRSGWTCRTHADGRSFLATMHRESYDAYVVDWGLPDMSGLDVLRAIRLRVPTNVPVLFLTARDAEHDVIEALEAGADDFLVKPARLGELQARLRALARRLTRRTPIADSFEHDRFRFDLKLQEAWSDGSAVDLTQKEFLLAILLLRNLGKPLSRGHIREIVWGRDSEVPSRTMDTHVSRVRTKLKLRPESGYLLAPVYSYGYRLEHLAQAVAVPSASVPQGR